MPIASFVENLDSVEESQRDLYIETEGGFALDTDVTLHPSAKALKNALNDERSKAKTVASELKKFQEVDLERWAKLSDLPDEELESNPENALAQPQPDVLFLMFDLDGLKGVNDSQGHAAGDHVLLQVRDILEDSCRKSDTVIRWGGDEFLVIARHTDRGQAERLAERIRRNVENHLFDVGTDVPTKLTCSIGFAYYPFVSGQEVSFSWEQIVTIADRALYVAKKSGRNAWVGLHETAKTRELDSFRLLQLVNEQLDELARRNHLRLETSLTSPEELVWAWS